jgi:hypothetical protein
MRVCEECGKKHPEDRLIEKYEFDWDTIKEFASKKEWTLSSKLASLIIELGNELEHQWHRAEFFNKLAEQRAKESQDS